MGSGVTTCGGVRQLPQGGQVDASMLSPASSVHLEQFKERHSLNWDKGRERLLSASADSGYFGNKV